ncbi:MAG: ARMT1-like domain-containing protein [Candidatus Margulisiibacteriota bacterium]|jgi:hypothetical protein
MKAFLECIPCILRQTAEVAKMVTTDPKLQLKAVRAATRILGKADPAKMSAPMLTTAVHKELKQVLKTKDLYKKVKEIENKKALAMYPELEKIASGAKDKLDMAVRLAILGNVLDYGAILRFDLPALLKKIKTLKFGKYDLEKFRRALISKKKILYIGDNAGEIVFDKLLIRELQSRDCEVVYAVKNEPILNDITMADAKSVGMLKLTKVIESGSTTPGTLMSEFSAEMKKAYRWADLIIAKGQGNLETCDNWDKPVFFLLKMKCPYLADRIKVKTGDLMLWQR